MSGQPTELIGRRTEKSKTFEYPDGSFIASIFTGPIHYRDDAGRWQDISSKLIPSTEPGYSWRNEASAFGASFKADLGDDFLRLDIAGTAFAWSLLGALPVRVATSGVRASYPNALRGVSI